MLLRALFKSLDTGRPLFYLLVSLLLLNAAPLRAEDDSSGEEARQVLQQLLIDMDSKAASLSYAGTMVYSQGTRMETLKRFHAVQGGKRRERLVHLSGEPRETIREGDKVYCLSTREGVITFSSTPSGQPFARSFSQQVLATDRGYDVLQQGRNRVAGREAVQLHLIPRDQYRYGFRLALDKSSGLLLQSLMLDEKGKVIERFEYLDIAIGEAVNPADLQPSLASAESVAALRRQPSGGSPKESRQSGRQWRINWVPPGFFAQAAESTAEAPQVTAGRNGAAMWTDGLSAFSVFVTDQVNLGQSTHRSGATTAHTVVKRMQNSVYSVTVIGEIPRAAAEKIAASVTPVANGAA